MALDPTTHADDVIQNTGMSSSVAYDESHNMMTPASFYKIKDLYQPTLGETASAEFAQAWDRSMGVRIAENWSFSAAEKEANEAGTNYVFKNKEEFEASDYYAQGVEFFEGMSAEWARRNKIEYDKRRRRQAILNAADRNGNSWIYAPVSFGAGMLGGALDPVNALVALIPIPGLTAVKSTVTAGLTGRQVLAQSLKPGVIAAGAGANLLSSAYAAWDLNPKGENITFQDIMVDTMMGAALAPVFHAGGTMFSRHRARSKERQIVEGLIAEHPEGKELTKLLEGMKKNEPKAYQAFGSKIEEWNQANVNRYNALDYIRKRVTPAERSEISRWMEFALTEVADGRPLDVSQIINTPQAQATWSRIETLVNEYRATQNEAPVVVGSIRAAKTEFAKIKAELVRKEAELGKIETDFAKLEGAKGVSAIQSLPEGHPVRVSLAALRNAVKDVGAIFSEIDALQAKKKTQLQHLRAAETRLEAAYQAYSDFVSKYESNMVLDPRVKQHLKDVARSTVAKALPDIENAIGSAKAKIADLNTQIAAKLGDITPADRTKVNFQPTRDPQPVSTEPLRKSEASTREAEYAEQGIGKDGVSDVEQSLGKLTPEERKLIDPHFFEKERVLRKKNAVLRDSNIVECMMSAGALQ